MKRTLISLTLFVAGFLAHSFMDSSAMGNPNLTVTRFGWVIELKPEMIRKYKQLHAHPWPAVNAKLKDCNISNYSIYMKEVAQGKHMLFSYLEYTGTDFEADMAKMAADPETQRWWKETDPCQKAIETAGEGEWWSTMEEIYHLD